MEIIKGYDSLISNVPYILGTLLDEKTENEQRTLNYKKEVGSLLMLSSVILNIINSEGNYKDLYLLGSMVPLGLGICFTSPRESMKKVTSLFLHSLNFGVNIYSLIYEKDHFNTVASTFFMSASFVLSLKKVYELNNVRQESIV